MDWNSHTNHKNNNNNKSFQFSPTNCEIAYSEFNNIYSIYLTLSVSLFMCVFVFSCPFVFSFLWIQITFPRRIQCDLFEQKHLMHMSDDRKPLCNDLLTKIDDKPTYVAHAFVWCGRIQLLSTCVSVYVLGSVSMLFFQE